MDRAKRKLSFISVLIAALLVAFLGMLTFIGLRQSADTAHAEEHTHDGWTEWTTTDGLPSSAGSYYLAADVTLSSTWTVPAGTTNLCLNGHGIKRSGNGSVISIGNGSALGLYDCGDSVHYFDVNEKSCAINVNDTEVEGRHSFVGGYITGGNAFTGGGISVNGGTFDIYGGTILGNFVDGSGNKGGAVYVVGGAAVTMYGGSVSYNYAQNVGAGFYVNHGTFTLIDGVISYNKTNWSGGSAVALQNDNSDPASVFNMYGGVIEKNDTKNNYGAVDVSTGAKTRFNVKENAVIRNNYSGTASNVHNVTLRSDHSTQAYINIVGVFQGARIGVSGSAPFAFTSGWSEIMGDADPADYFKSDNGYEILLIGDEAGVHQHDYGTLVDQVDATCEADGMKAHYYCAGCGTYFDENGSKTTEGALVIRGGHAYTHVARVNPTCDANGMREHFYCAKCGQYLNTNKQTVTEYNLRINRLGHKYDTDSIEFTWTPDESASYKWRATAYYTCTTCGERFEKKNVSVSSYAASWNVDAGIRAYVQMSASEITAEPKNYEYSYASYSSTYTIYSARKYLDSGAGTATIHKWTAWEEGGLPNRKQPSGSEGWYLTEDVTLTDTWTVPVTDIKLCLNGHVIKGDFSTSKTVIYVRNGISFELYEYNFDDTHYYYIGRTVTDSHGAELNFVGQIAESEEDSNYIAAARKGSFKGGYVTGGTGKLIGSTTYGGAVYVDGDTNTSYVNCGDFVIEGATLFGNYADYGGGVYVKANGYFDLYSGNVIGNQAGSEGGGVYANKRNYSDSSQDSNYGMHSYYGVVKHNTAGQSGNGYGGGIAGWAGLEHSPVMVQGNAAVGENAKGGGIYGFLKTCDANVCENYTTGVGPGVYVTNRNLKIDSNAHLNFYSNRYATKIDVNAIDLAGPGDIYFETNYKLNADVGNYPPYATDGVRSYVEMQSIGAFSTNWVKNSNYDANRYFAALPGYKITENGKTLSLQVSSGNVTVDTSKSLTIYTTYYYKDGVSTSFTSDETHRFVFSGTRTNAPTFGVYAYLNGENDVYLRFDHLDLTATGSNYLFYVYPYYGALNVYIELVGDSVLRTNGTTAFIGGNVKYPVNVYFTGEGTITFADSAENASNNAFGTYPGKEVNIHLKDEDITIYEILKENIANIGIEVTFTQEIKERIETARAAYDALSEEERTKISNYPVLVAAEAAYRQAAIQGAIDLIDAIPDPVVYTPECKAAIDAARAAYDSLDNEELKELFAPDDPQERVTNRQKLFDAEYAYSVYLVEEVKAKIEALPDPIDKDSKDAITDARTSYEKLPDEKKGEVDNYEKLVQAEIRYVDVMIESIGSVVYTTECKESIDAARAEYDALPEDEKTEVANYEDLEKAEGAYEKLKNDHAAADAVDALIDLIDAPAVYTAECKEKIDAARAAYDELTEDQKALVVGYTKLTDTEATYRELKIGHVEDLIAAIDDPVVYTSECKAAIDAARTAYDALFADEQSDVANYEVLEAAESAYAKLKDDHDKADAVDALIALIDPIVVYPDSYAGIEAARRAYDALTDDQMALVQGYDDLLNAEKECRERAIEYVIDLIDHIPDPVVFTEECEQAITSAREEYDILFEDEQAKVTNYTVLVDAENEYAMFKFKSEVPEEGEYKLSGFVVSSNYVLVDGATVTLKRGDQEVASMVTSRDGAYRFVASKGVYTIVVEYGSIVETSAISLFEETEKNFNLLQEKTESKLEVTTEDLVVAVDGLEQVAQTIRKENPEAETISVVMTVERKEEDVAENSDQIREEQSAQEKNLEFFDIKVEKKVDGKSTVIPETATVLEVVIPYAKADKRELKVYSYHGAAVIPFEEITERTNSTPGTFYVDVPNKVIYVYTNSFSTYAIGYMPYYHVKVTPTLGSYQGYVDVTLADRTSGEIVASLAEVPLSEIEFNVIRKGDYDMTFTWTDNSKHTLTIPVRVGPKEIDKSEPEESLADPEADPADPETDPGDPETDPEEAAFAQGDSLPLGTEEDLPVTEQAAETHPQKGKDEIACDRKHREGEED